MILSILIPTTKDREGMTWMLIKHLLHQGGGISSGHLKSEDGFILHTMICGQIEIIKHEDSYSLSTGNKRNRLYEMANGKYSVSVDSDDWVPDYYIEELLKAAESDADCFGINGIMITDNIKTETWNISKDNPYKTVAGYAGRHFLRYPNHITPIKSEICKQFKFPDSSL